MLRVHLAGILAKYHIYLNPNGTIKIDREAVSIAFAHASHRTGMEPPTVTHIVLRKHAQPYVNEIKTLKEVCKKYDIPLRVIDEAFKI